MASHIAIASCGQKYITVCKYLQSPLSLTIEIVAYSTQIVYANPHLGLS